MTRTRSYCKCPYCPFLSRKYHNVIGHLENKHPDDEQYVLERYDNIPPEVTDPVEQAKHRAKTKPSANKHKSGTEET